jgi:ferredoxin--NADP+ reductase
MAYVIAPPCIADYACIDVCPVDCISPRPQKEGFDDTEQLYINPEACINCGACVDACPVLAIFTDDGLPPKWRHYAEINRDYFARLK